MSELPTNPQLPNRILVVDDEPLVARMVAYIIKDAELGESVQCGDSREVAAFLASGNFDLVLLDLNMPWLSGQEVLEEISRDFPDVPVIILTNEDRIEVAVECMRKGAFDFMTKPIERNRLISAVRHGLTIRELKREVTILSSRREEQALANPGAFAAIVTRSRAMRSLFSYIETIAASPKAILITGESGTGKELIAEVIHKLSMRSGRFVPINVSGLDDTVFSDSLFGHLKGSFTGADAVRKGLIEQARDGTLFLDEIGDLDSGPQIKLLRLLQEGEYYPLGSDAPMKSRARVVAATNASLKEKQDRGTFRRDLYFRLVSHHIELPPLRDRREDLEPLLDHFVKEAAATLARPVPRIPDQTIGMLGQYEFPGNVRELQGMVFDAVSRTRGAVLELSGLAAYLLEHQPGIRFERREHVPEPVPAVPETTSLAGPSPEPQKRENIPDNPAGMIRGPADLWLGRELPHVHDAEDFLFATALERSGGNQSSAAAMLGISQPTLSRWLRGRRGGKPLTDPVD